MIPGKKRTVTPFEKEPPYMNLKKQRHERFYTVIKPRYPSTFPEMILLFFYPCCSSAKRQRRYENLHLLINQSKMTVKIFSIFYKDAITYLCDGHIIFGLWP
jgi:hypothetical protein